MALVAGFASKMQPKMKLEHLGSMVGTAKVATEGETEGLVGEFFFSTYFNFVYKNLNLFIHLFVNTHTSSCSIFL